MNVILGGGLAGLSTSYHLGHDRCIILEKNSHPFGHISSENVQGFTWDIGPHVSFTKHEYVRQLFSESVNGGFEEYSPRTINYFQGTWIDHPAQSNLYQVPEPLRSECLDDLLNTRKRQDSQASPATAANYGEWLDAAFGRTFADTFPRVYTRKYWAIEAENMTVDWIGPRVFYPTIDEVTTGAKERLDRQTHYINSVRYPSTGGYQAFAASLARGANVHLNSEVERIDLRNRVIYVSGGRRFDYQTLINTLPLPLFASLCVDAPADVKEASNALSCSELMLINVMVPHPTQQQGNWWYIYDEDKLSTRINCTEKLSPRNAPRDHSGIQVEVYASKSKKFSEPPQVMARKVLDELCEMEFIDPSLLHGEEVVEGLPGVSFFTKHVSWANVIFDHNRREALQTILDWLAAFGLEREDDDLDPTTDWENKLSQFSRQSKGSLFMAGRYGQWKYYWTDDCVLRGKLLASRIQNQEGPIPKGHRTNVDLPE